MPFDKIVAEVTKEVKLRRLVRNMIYCGILSHLLSIDMGELEKAIDKQFERKAKAVQLNTAALMVGQKYAGEHFQIQHPFRVERMNETAGMVLVEGNEAAAIGCLFAGVTVIAWYPITPSSGVPEMLTEFLKRYRIDKATGKATFAVVQAEDEIASIGMVVGAGWAGARAMTATSGPGISLMTEFVGLAYYTEVPAVIFNIQRIGPATGLPTRTSQGDVLFSVFNSHGDTEHPILVPGSVGECYSMAIEAFDLAERLQTPVYVLMRPRPGHERLDVPGVPVSGQADGSRQGPRRGQGEGTGRGLGPLQGHRRRRHSVAVDSRDRGAGVLHARLRAQRDGRLQRAA